MTDPTRSLDPPDDAPDDPPDDSPDDSPAGASKSAAGASMGDRPLVPQDDPEPPDDLDLEEDA
jgi:hypothetical protein